MYLWLDQMSRPMRKFLLRLLMGASLTTSVFVFQACYGPPMPPEEIDVPRNQTELQEAISDGQEPVDSQAVLHDDESEDAQD